MSTTQLTVRVHKKELLAALQKHRKNHDNEFGRAKAAWDKRMTKLHAELKGLLPGALASGPGNNRLMKAISSLHQLAHVRPTWEVGRYDTIISMVSHHSEDTIELTQDQFNAYFQDDWEWKSEWRVATSNYMVGG